MPNNISYITMFKIIFSDLSSSQYIMYKWTSSCSVASKNYLLYLQ